MSGESKVISVGLFTLERNVSHEWTPPTFSKMREGGEARGGICSELKRLEVGKDPFTVMEKEQASPFPKSTSL